MVGILAMTQDHHGIPAHHGTQDHRGIPILPGHQAVPVTHMVAELM